MSMVLEIPDEAVEAMHLPPAEVEAELRKELAVALYARQLLSLGKSAEWAGVTRQEFESLLAQRRIERPYDSTEVERDLAWAKRGT
jgi:predicted HTH domain antitoxin